jgi:hypothetical protein
LEAVIDTVTMQHITRSIIKVDSKTFGTVFDKHIQRKSLFIGLDDQNGLLNEWERTCGKEIIGVIYTYWESLQGFKPVKVKKLPASINKKLRALGFGGDTATIDKLILKIALELNNKIVVSSDSHFWNPTNKRQIGNSDAPVAELCRRELDILVMILPNFLEY